MKKILLTPLTALFFYFSVNAQFDKGSLLLGGQLSYSSTNSSNSNILGLSQTTHNGYFNISLGKAIRENAVFGIVLSYTPFTAKNYYNTSAGWIDRSTDNYGIGVYYRVYKSLGKEFYLFGEGGAGFTTAIFKDKDSLGNTLNSGSGSGANIYLMPGISYKISKKFFLEMTIPNLFQVSYNSSTLTYSGQGSTDTKTFNISTSLSANPLSALGIGFRLIL